MPKQVLWGVEYCWDEKAVHETHNVRHSGHFCVRHDWINASLHFQKNRVDVPGFWYLPLEENSHTGWGNWYGGIRFCRKCKAIDCIHQWEDAPPISEIWKSCDHNWMHPARHRFECSKCGAQFNWMCGCGGSSYVCDSHYYDQIDKIRSLLNDHCIGPSVPIIQKCKICGRKIKRT